MRAQPAWSGLVAALAGGTLLAGCQGSLTEPEFQPPGPALGAVADFECVEGSAPTETLRRLSRVQHRNTIESLLARFYAPDEVGAILAAAGPALDTRPTDLFADHPDEAGQRLFARSDQAFSEALVRADLRSAEAVAAEMTSSAPRIAAWAGDCAVDADASNDAACLDAIVDEVGRLTHRRPLTDAERAFFRREAYIDGDVVVTEGLAELLTVFLAQPAFVLHLEGDGELTAYEAASRLSYHFWNTMPDEPLFAAAADGSLLTEQGWGAQVDRLLQDPRAEGALRELLDEWFKLDRTRGLSSGSGPAYEALRGDLVYDSALDRAVDEEIADLFLYLVRNGGTFRDFFLSDLTLTQSPELAALYGMEPSPDGQPVTVPPERVGVLTRAAMLLSRSDLTPPGPGPRTHPILRGVFITRQILCDFIAPPPAGAVDAIEAVDQTTTSSREGTELITSGGTCRGCHEQLNAPGFALEEFDSLGRYRAEERLFDPDGVETGSVSVDTQVYLSTVRADVSGGVELGERLYESEMPSACFARHYVRFALGRPEEPLGADSCLLRDIDEAIDADRPLGEVLGMVVLNPGFRVRVSGGAN